MKNDPKKTNTGLEEGGKKTATNRKAKTAHAKVAKASNGPSLPKLTKNEKRGLRRANKALRDAEKRAKDAGLPEDATKHFRLGEKTLRQRKARQGHKGVAAAVNNVILHHSDISYPGNIAEFCESLEIFNQEEGNPYPKTLEVCRGLIRNDGTKWRYRSLDRVLRYGLIEPGGSVRSLLITYTDKFTKEQRKKAEKERYGHPLTDAERDEWAVTQIQANITTYKTKRYK